MITVDEIIHELNTTFCKPKMDILCFGHFDRLPALEAFHRVLNQPTSECVIIITKESFSWSSGFKHWVRRLKYIASKEFYVNRYVLYLLPDQDLKPLEGYLFGDVNKYLNARLKDF